MLYNFSILSCEEFHEEPINYKIIYVFYREKYNIYNTYSRTMILIITSLRAEL